MQDSAEFREFFRELQITIDSALATISLISEHGIIESQNFEQLVAYMHSAAATVDGMRILQMIEDQYIPADLPQNRGIGRGALRVVR